MKSQSQDHSKNQKSASFSVNSQPMNSINSSITLRSLIYGGQLPMNSRTAQQVQINPTSGQQNVIVIFEQQEMTKVDNAKDKIKAQCNKIQSDIRQQQNIVNHANYTSFHSSKQSNSQEILQRSQQIKIMQNNAQISLSKEERYLSVLAKSQLSQNKNSQQDKLQSGSFTPFSDKNVQPTDKQVSGNVEISNSDATIEKILNQIKKEKEFEELLDKDVDDNIQEKGFLSFQNQTNNSSNKSIDNVDIGAIESQFAYKDKDEGYYHQAIKHFENALALQSQSIKNIQYYVNLLINVAEAYFEVSNYPKSAQKCQQVIQIGIEKISNPKIVINFYRIYSDCLRFLEKYDLALNIALKALEITKNEFGLNNKQTHEIYCVIGSIYAFQKKFDKAFEYDQKSFNLAKKLNNDSQFSRECLKSLSNLGFCYYYQGNYQKDLQNSLHMQKIYDKILHKNDSTFITLYSDIGLAYVHLKKYDQAATYFQKAENKFKQFNIEDRLKNAFLIFNYCLLEKSKGNYDKALEYLDKSEIILKQKLPPNHFYLDQAKSQRETILKLKEKKLE